MNISAKAISVGFLLTACLGSGAAEEPRKSESNLDLARRLNAAFAETAEKASSSVVIIRVNSHTAPPATNPRNPWDIDLQELPPELRRYFEGHLPPAEPSSPQASRDNSDRLSYEGQGSGIILKENGYLLTNRHVVEGAETIDIKLPDGREFPAKLCGADLPSDLAVLKVEARGLPTAKLGNSDALRVGEFALAIGAPFELESTVTFGHISAKGRQNILEDSGLDQDFLQTDAQINPGNSGGPLVNLDGEVIGINTLIRGMRTGIGFAIPINQVKEVADQLIKNGRYQRPWIGISVRSLRDNNALRDAFPEAPEGLVVRQIETGSPAAHSDLKAGDLITEINGQPVANVADFKRQLRNRRIGDSFALAVSRGGRNRTVTVKTMAQPERGEDDPPSENTRRAEEIRELGMLLKPLPPELAAQEGLSRGQGVLVSDVAVGSLAEQSGLKPGAILTELNRRPISNLKQFRDNLKSIAPGKTILLNFVSDGASRFEVLRAETDH